MDWNIFINEDNNSFLSCFYMCLNKQCDDNKIMTYDMAVKHYIIDKHDEFYANDGDWSMYWSDDEHDDFDPDEILGLY